MLNLRSTRKESTPGCGTYKSATTTHLPFNQIRGGLFPETKQNSAVFVKPILTFLFLKQIFMHGKFSKKMCKYATIHDEKLIVVIICLLAQQSGVRSHSIGVFKVPIPSRPTYSF